MAPQYTFKSSGPSTRPSRMKPPPQPDFPPPFPSQTTYPRSRSSSLSSTTSFTSAVSNHNDETLNDSKNKEPPSLPRFSPAEEASMLSNSNTLKLAANKQFTSKDYSSAISTYDKALAELPIYLDYELAVLQSNISACHLQLGEWKDAIESAERGLDCLERELPMTKPEAEAGGKDGKKTKKGMEGKINGVNGKDEGDDSQIVELPDDATDETAAEILANLNISDQKRSDVTRIRSKLLLRRARARFMTCETAAAPKQNQKGVDLDAEGLTEASDGNPSQPRSQNPFSSSPEGSKESSTSHWSNLSGALADYQTLATPEYFSILPQADKKTVTQMLATLPTRVETAKKKEVDEMMGKLKELGNGILKPFGLSTDMFKMTQDPKTGGWSMGFDSGGGKKS